jgi:hypothetical protein
VGGERRVYVHLVRQAFDDVQLRRGGDHTQEHHDHRLSHPDRAVQWIPELAGDWWHETLNDEESARGEDNDNRYEREDGASTFEEQRGEQDREHADGETSDGEAATYGDHRRADHQHEQEHKRRRAEVKSRGREAKGGEDEAPRAHQQCEGRQRVALISLKRQKHANQGHRDRQHVERDAEHTRSEQVERVVNRQLGADRVQWRWFWHARSYFRSSGRCCPLILHTTSHRLPTGVDSVTLLNRYFHR